MMHSIDIARTHEILARYRPIAPKPAVPPQTVAVAACGLDGASSLSPETLALHHLPPRISKSRKRGRAGCSCVVSQKRPKIYAPVLPSPDVSLPLMASKTAHLGVSMQGPGQGYPVLPLAGPRFRGKMEKPAGSGADLLTLSLVPFSSSASSCLAGHMPKSETHREVKGTTLDLNAEPEATAPVERDLTLSPPSMPQVIVPQPVRPVGSSISVGPISEDKVEAPAATLPTKRPEEVEEEVESEVLPAVVSDSNNRVRLANAAYKEMVGQPECSWLDSMVGSRGVRAKAGSRRINGEVMLDLSGSAVPISSNGFSCRVTIEWARNGRKTFIRAPCDVNKLFCESNDYLFAWRFHTEDADADFKS